MLFFFNLFGRGLQEKKVIEHHKKQICVTDLQYTVEHAVSDGVKFDRRLAHAVSIRANAAKKKALKLKDKKISEQDQEHSDSANQDPQASFEKLLDSFKFLDCTKGWLVAVRPCGMVVNLRMLQEQHEGATQAALILADILQAGYDEVEYLVYDRACELSKHVRLRSDRIGSLLKSKLDGKMVLDAFHAKHKHDTCVLHIEGSQEINPLCEYHPGLPQFKDILDSNTEQQELASKWLNRFIGLMRHMKPVIAEFLMWEIANENNKRLQKRLL